MEPFTIKDVTEKEIDRLTQQFPEMMKDLGVYITLKTKKGCINVETFSLELYKFLKTELK
jgi:hypothetical protein